MGEPKTRSQILKPTFKVLVLNDGSEAEIDWLNKFKSLMQESGDSLKLTQSKLKSIGERQIKDQPLIIFNMSYSANEYARAFSVLRDFKFTGAVICPFGKIDEWQETKTLLSVNVKDWNFIVLPCMADDVMGLVRRVLSLNSYHPRTYARIRLDNPASIKIANADISCTVRDVSNGGACVNLKGTEKLSKGEMVTLSFALDGLNPKAQVNFATNNIKARVVWVNPYRRLVGLEFLKG